MTKNHETSSETLLLFDSILFDLLWSFSTVSHKLHQQMKVTDCRISIFLNILMIFRPCWQNFWDWKFIWLTLWWDYYVNCCYRDQEWTFSAFFSILFCSIKVRKHKRPCHKLWDLTPLLVVQLWAINSLFISLQVRFCLKKMADNRHVIKELMGRNIVC